MNDGTPKHDRTKEAVESARRARREETEPERVCKERDLFRAALVRIADGESGVWGWIAHDALKAASLLGAK